jgi:dihydrolipoamide dehydrogenase
MSKTDLIIIGAGPGGYRAAEYAAKQGLKVTIFEGSDVGGTCLNVGCIPTKTYVHSKTFEEARERMAQVVSQLRAGVEGILSHPNITLIRENAYFENLTEGTVPIVRIQGGGERYEADNVIIATGSETKWLPIKGKDDPRVVDSTGLLQLDTLPKRLTIIGAGVIGMEFASVFRRFGSEVTVIEYLKECLPALDSDIAKRLRKYLEKQGITFKMKTAVENIADLDADVILMATGRKPRTDGLNLEALGITLAPNGAIPVDDDFEVITKFKVFAIGDVNGRQMLAHAAEAQAVYVVKKIVNRQSVNRKWLDIMPAAIFTEPEAACVGPTEDQLKEQGIAYVCKKSFWRANGKALAMNATEGMLKLFISPPKLGGVPEGRGGLKNGLILGCHAYGAHAADIVQELSVLMCKHTTIDELADMVHIHPTLSEILKNAAEN